MKSLDEEEGELEEEWRRRRLGGDEAVDGKKGMGEEK